jgi:hypothetical protein
VLIITCCIGGDLGPSLPAFVISALSTLNFFQKTACFGVPVSVAPKRVTFEQPRRSLHSCPVPFCTEASNQQQFTLRIFSGESANMLHILLVALIFCFSAVQADIYLYGARHEVVR